MKRILAIVLAFAFLANAASPELTARAEKIQEKAAAFLYPQQLFTGTWLMNPAITALVVLGLQDAKISQKPENRAKLDLAIESIAKSAQPNGTILNPRDRRSYPVYSTSICLLALVKANRPQDAQIIRNARDYLLSVDPTPEDSDNRQPDKQGFGYGKRQRADLNNTSWALEALAATDHLDREPLNQDPERAKKADLAWSKALTFLSSCQNLADTNQSAWIKSAPADDIGGFIYCPEDAMKHPDQKEMLRSYGSMTYSGLKSLIYARVKPDDPRITAATKWLQKHYTLEENYGVGQSGYYYYLHTFAKTLAVLKVDSFTDDQGTVHDWRTELIDAIEKRQQPDGSFVNSASGRWWENVPILATSYVLMALDTALK